MLAVISLLLAACTDDQTVDSTTTAPIDDDGRLAILDDSGDVVVIDPDGSGAVGLTDDGGTDAAYTQPTWAPDSSRLAWGKIGRNAFSVEIGSPDSEQQTSLVTPNLPFYTSWSPDGNTLAVLHNGSTGVVFRLIDVETSSNEAIDEDAPYYFSWSPQSDGLVTHAGADRVEYVGLDGAREETAATAAGYLAPQWTPAGILHVDESGLVVDDGSGRRSTVARTSGTAMFVANPQGTQVAIQTAPGTGGVEVSQEEPPELATGSVQVVDLETKESVTVSEGLALGFFWSPDGASLLVMKATADGIEPRVWSREGTKDFPRYQPTRTMLRDLFPFFPQYAQSVSFWSPDSAAFAFAGAIDDERGIWVQDLATDAPQKVADGVWVAWSGPEG